MIRNLKVLGLALVATVTMGVATASAAQFHLETVPSTITGSQTVSMSTTFDGGAQKHCTSIGFDATVSGTTTFSNIVGSIVYNGCTFTPFGSSTIHPNGCKHAINPNGHVALTGCTNANKSIVMTGPFCTIEITEAQNKTLEKVSFKNVGAGTTREVEVVANINNIVYHANGFACSYGNNTTGGKAGGTLKLTAENPVTGAHHGFWWSA